MVKQYKLEQWKDLIQSQEESGLTPTSWCNQNQIINQRRYLETFLENR